MPLRSRSTEESRSFASLRRTPRGDCQALVRVGVIVVMSAWAVMMVRVAVDDFGFRR